MIQPKYNNKNNTIWWVLTKLKFTILVAKGSHQKIIATRRSWKSETIWNYLRWYVPSNLSRLSSKIGIPLKKWKTFHFVKTLCYSNLLYWFLIFRNIFEEMEKYWNEFGTTSTQLVLINYSYCYKILKSLPYFLFIQQTSPTWPSQPPDHRVLFTLGVVFIFGIVFIL